MRPFNTIRSLWRSWVALLSRRESVLGLALFRIAIGLVVLYSLLSVGLSGLIDAYWLDAAYGGFRPLGAGPTVVAYFGGPKPAVIYPLYGIAVAAALLVTAGVGGRVVIFIALHSYVSLVDVNPELRGGYDSMLSNALWLLVLSRAGDGLSLSRRLRTGRWSTDDLIPAWPRYLAVFQLVTVYTTTGLHKLSAAWTPVDGYKALYYVFQEPTWRRFDMSFTASMWAFPLTQIATAVTWCFEVGAPLLLLVYYFRYTRERPGRLRALCLRRDLRLLFAAVGLSLHVGILITLNVGPFSWVSMAYYLCLWHPDELRAIMRKRQ